jgi:thiamine monophosphate synthase
MNVFLRELSERYAEANILPVMAASGLNASNVALAIKAGAVAVGIGAAINQLSSVEAMVEELQAIQQAVTSTAGVATLAVAV